MKKNIVYTKNKKDIFKINVKFLKNLSVKFKLRASYIILSFLILLTTLISIKAIDTVNNNSNRIYNINFKSIQIIDKINSNVKEIDSYLMNIFMTLDKNQSYKYSNKIKVLLSQNQSFLNDYESINTTDIEKNKFNELKEYANDLEKCCLNILDLINYKKQMKYIMQICLE